MNFNFSKDQIILRKSAREFIKKEIPASLVRELLVDEKGYSPKVWEKMAELGWLGIAIDEEFGGIGADFMDLAILFEELGRGAVPSPFFSTVLLGGFLLQNHASEELKNRYLPKIVEGKSIITAAISDEKGFYGKNHVGITAKNSNGSYLLSGSVLFVSHANVSDMIICAAKMDSNNTGITLFAVDRKAKGLTATPLKTIFGNYIDYSIALDNVMVSPEMIIGEECKGWDYIEKIWPLIITAQSCECVGGMQKVMDMTRDYLNGRIQFGKPLSALQIVQHMSVDMFTKVETSKLTAHSAAWSISEGLDSENEAAIAKSWCAEAYKDVTKIAHQVTGAIGFTEEYDLHLYTKSAKKLELLFGDGAYQRKVVADKLGL